MNNEKAGCYIATRSAVSSAVSSAIRAEEALARSSGKFYRVNWLGQPIDSMDYEHIQFSIEDGVGFIVLNRPDVLNSFNEKMSLELQDCLGQIGPNAQIRSVHLTGAGRAFCAGQDLADVLPKDGISRNLADIVSGCYNPIIRLIRSIEKPFVCAVNGVAAGAGANLAFACDIVLASDKASFVQSFCKIGLVPDSGGTYFLPRLVGLPRATAMAMLGDKVRADDAEAMGLIYRSVEHDKLIDESRVLALKLATQPTIGIGYIKRALNESLNNTLPEQLDLEAELQGLAGATADYSEGVNAFVEKRSPKFSGN